MSYEQPLNAIEEAPEALRPIMAALCTTAIALAKTIARGPLGGSLGHLVGENSDGDGQKALDVMADNAFADALKAHSVRWYASEEQETVVELDSKGRYAIAIDPLDGSSNIDVNVSIGTIFSVYEARPEAEESFLRPAREQIAAGYFIYGPQTGLVVTFGQGSFHYIWDDEQRRFVKVGDALCLTETSREFAINASNYRQWHKPVRTFIDDYLAGENGPHGQNFNMRWVASLVADTHRILSRGGIFLYPGDNRPGYKDGRLRMVYECAPIAMLIAQAGGEATDGSDSILDKAAPSLHARTPFIFGSSAQVKQMTNYHDLPEQEVSALFGKRGLFRAPA